MADIFLSYSRTDKPRVAPLVAALEAKGWSIWWDMALASGEEFDAVTAAALESARAVLVVWTPTSVASRWVRGEARVGADRGVLAPVRFDNATLPIDLRAIQTTDLDEWGGDPKHPSFQTLHQSLIGMLGAPSKDGPPCVGRARELERVRALIAGAGRGEGGFLLFSGEAGVGKTRMTVEAERAAKEAGFTVLRGHCGMLDSAPPYQPALEQIEQSARELGPDRMRKSMGENAPEICRLMPELLQRYDDVPPYPTLPPEQERRYLLHGLAEFVARGAALAPVMLIYEDLHLADESTCVLLTYLAERMKNEPVLMIGAYRDGELAEGRPFARALQDLVRRRLVEDARLSRLSAADVAERLMRQFGPPPPASLVELIYSKSEGNPFFVEEVIRHLDASGKLLTETGKFQAKMEMSDAELTRGVRLIIEDRVGQAGALCREVLTLAAVAGRAFNFDLLVKADPKREEDEILAAVEEAARRQIIEDVSTDRVARYRFVHEQIRQSLLSALSLPRRQRLHLRIADALEASARGAADKYAGEIGHHLYQAGAAADPARTARYLGAAGERAIQALAFEDALRHLDLALAISEEQGEPAARAQLQALRADALRGCERIAEALEALARAAALAPDEPTKDEYKLRRCRLLIDVWRGAEAVADLEALLARAQASGDPKRDLDVQRVVARCYYVMSLDRKDYTHKCKEAFERAIALARALDDKRALSAMLTGTANLRDYFPDYRRRVRANLLEAAALAREVGDEEAEIDAECAQINLLDGDPGREERLLERLLARRDPIRLNALYFRMMWSALYALKLERCVEICNAGIELAGRIGAPPVQYPTIKAFAFMDLGRFDEAWASLDEEIASEGYRFGAALRDMGKLFQELRLGAYEAALARAPGAIEAAHEVMRAWMLSWIARELALLSPFYAGDQAMLGRIDALIASTGAGGDPIADAAVALARGDAAAARAAIGAAPGRRDTPWADLGRTVLRAQIEAAAHDWTAALTIAKAGAEQARAHGAKYKLWRLLSEQALIEDAMGASAAALETRQAARVLWTEMGGSIGDSAQRASFLRGPLPTHLQLLR